MPGLVENEEIKKKKSYANIVYSLRVLIKEEKNIDRTIYIFVFVCILIDCLKISYAIIYII